MHLAIYLSIVFLVFDKRLLYCRYFCVFQITSDIPRLIMITYAKLPVRTFLLTSPNFLNNILLYLIIIFN